jgi:hypothetical protein
VGLKLNGTHQLPAYSNDVNLLVSNYKTNHRNVFDASKEVGPEVNIEKTKYMLVTHYQNADRNQDI